MKSHGTSKTKRNGTLLITFSVIEKTYTNTQLISKEKSVQTEVVSLIDDAKITSWDIIRDSFKIFEARQIRRSPQLC